MKSVSWTLIFKICKNLLNSLNSMITIKLLNFCCIKNIKGKANKKNCEGITEHYLLSARGGGGGGVGRDNLHLTTKQ